MCTYVQCFMRCMSSGPIARESDAFRASSHLLLSLDVDKRAWPAPQLANSKWPAHPLLTSKMSISQSWLPAARRLPSGENLSSAMAWAEKCISATFCDMSSTCGGACVGSCRVSGALRSATVFLQSRAPQGPPLLKSLGCLRPLPLPCECPTGSPSLSFPSL